jgi:hypothetical protein
LSSSIPQTLILKGENDSIGPHRRQFTLRRCLYDPTDRAVNGHDQYIYAAGRQIWGAHTRISLLE